MKALNNEFSSNEGYEELYNKDKMHLLVKPGSAVNGKIPLIRMSYFIEKSELPPQITLEIISAYMSSPEKRKIWDDQMNDYVLLDGTDTNGVVYLWMKKPVVFISERDMIEKLISFKGDDNAIYSFSSSVNDDVSIVLLITSTVLPIKRRSHPCY